MTKNRTGVFYDKVSAERLLLAGLSAPDLKDSDQEGLEKNGPEKYAISWLVRRNACLKNQWIKGRLKMGVATISATFLKRLESRDLGADELGGIKKSMDTKITFFFAGLAVLVLSSCNGIPSSGLEEHPAQLSSAAAFEKPLDNSATNRVQTGLSPFRRPRSKAELARMSKVHDYVEGREEIDSVICTSPPDGFIDLDKATKIASTRMHTRVYNKNKKPTVLLLDECYVVMFPNFDNPYAARKKAFKTAVTLDARTGEAIGIADARGGTRLFMMDSKTPAKNDAEKLEHRERLKEKIMELENGVRTGRTFDEKPHVDMIAPEEAAILAKDHAVLRKRDFDNSKEPQVVLMGDTYIVVLWRDLNLVSSGGKTYDSRVAVDAKTGEIIGMEITQQ